MESLQRILRVGSRLKAKGASIVQRYRCTNKRVFFRPQAAQRSKITQINVNGNMIKDASHRSSLKENGRNAAIEVL